MTLMSDRPGVVLPGAVQPGVHTSVLEMIGNTPVVDVSNLSPNPGVRILAKMESQNPFGSVKDRIAKSIFEHAERDGVLRPGQTILEPSSGNTGIALAAIAQIKGHPIKIMMPTSVSVERRQMLEVFGAELLLTPGEEGSNGAVARARALAAEHPEVVARLSKLADGMRARLGDKLTEVKGSENRAPGRVEK